MNITICGPINPSEFSDVLNYTDKLPNINRGASAVNTYVRELLRMGHKVVVVTQDVPSNEKDDIVLKGENLIIHIVHSNAGIYISHALSRFYMVTRLKKVLKGYIPKTDVLHAQWSYDYAYASMKFKKQVPVFCTVRDWAPYITTLQKGLKRWQWKAYTVMSNKVLGMEGVHLIANSEYTYNSIKKVFPAKEVAIIYNPIDKELILNKKIVIPAKDEFVTIASSVFEFRKNIRRLLEAFHQFHTKHPEVFLNVIGDYSGHKKEIESLKASSLLDGVRLLGSMRHRQLIEIIDKCTCLVHPALEETFGNILLEGMARRVVVIGGKKSGAVPAVLQNGRCGILCDVEKTESMVDAMEKALDKGVQDVLINSATTELNDKYNSEVIVYKHLMLYNKFLNNKIVQ